MCNVIVIQRVTNAALGGTCVTGTSAVSHSVTLKLVGQFDNRGDWLQCVSRNHNRRALYEGDDFGGHRPRIHGH